MLLEYGALSTATKGKPSFMHEGDECDGQIERWC